MNNLKGVTLIEMVVIIVLISLTVPPLIGMFSDITKRSTQSDLMLTGIVLARSMIEEITSKQYDEDMLTEGWPSSPWSNPLGADSGEASRADYDDIDDFDGLNENPVSAFPGFSRTVTVYYIDPDNYDLDTPRPDSSNTLDYKRIDVTVHNDLIGDIRMSTIVSRSHF